MEARQKNKRKKERGEKKNHPPKKYKENKGNMRAASPGYFNLGRLALLAESAVFSFEARLAPALDWLLWPVLPSSFLYTSAALVPTSISGPPPSTCTKGRDVCSDKAISTRKYMYSAVQNTVNERVQPFD